MSHFSVPLKSQKTYWYQRKPKTNGLVLNCYISALKLLMCDFSGGWPGLKSLG